MHVAAAAAAVLGGALGLLWGAAFLFQERLVYFPSRDLDADPSHIGLAFEEVRFQADDGTPLHGWYAPGPEGAATALFLHGNAGNISHRLDTLRILHGLSLSVLLFDYRGYGASGGRPSEEGTASDARGAFDHLTVGRGVPPGRIIAWGRSLGAAAAVRLALERCPGALVLESAFTSIPDMARLHYPLIPPFLARLRYPVLDQVRRVSCPVLVVHGRDDEIVPPDMGRRIFEAAPEPKAFLEIRGGHNEGFLLSEGDYAAGVGAFLAAHGLGRARP